jgi:hypothetical protein
MFPGHAARYRPRSIVTALVLMAIGLSCLWLSEAAAPRPQAALSPAAPMQSAYTLVPSR